MLHAPESGNTDEVQRPPRVRERSRPRKPKPRRPAGRADKVVEERIQEAEQKFRTIFDNTSDGIFLHDPETRKLIMCNKSCLRMLGYTQEEFANLSVSDLHPPADLSFIEAQIEEFLKGRNPIRNDIRFQRRDGSVFFVDLNADLVLLEGKRYVLVAMKDISERKRMEEELRRHAEHLEELVAVRTGELQESEARYRSLYHTLADGVFVMGAEGRIADVNDSACAQLGYTRAELIGMPVSAVSARPDFDVGEILDRLHATGRLSYETAHRRKDGTLIPVELSVALAEYRGRPAILAVARDTTERRRAQEALQFTQFAVDHTADAAFWMTEDARLFYVNEAACRSLGYSRDELLKMTVYDFDPAFTESMWRENWSKLKAQKSIVLETVHRARDGRVYPVEIRANYLEFGGRAYDCAFARDITERKRAEAALQESEQRYRRLVENLKGSHFVYRHDTKGMLTYVSESVTEVLGYTSDEGMPHYGTYFTDHPANQAAHRHTELTLQGIRQPSYEVNMWHKDGSTRWLEVQEVPVYDADGKVIAVEGVAQDITERKRAEEALREKEYLLSESQRIGHVGSWSVDLATDAVTWTRETYRLFGVSPDTFVPSADALIGLLHPDDRGPMWESIRAMREGEEPGVLEFRVVLPDGSLRTLSGRGEMILADSNEAVRLVGTVQDVTEQKRAQAALLESEERYRILLEKGFDGVFVHEDFRIVQLNDRLAEMTGYARAELVGSQGIDLFTPESQEHIRQYIRSDVGGCYEIELRRRDGRIVDVESFGAPCKFQGRNARIVGLRDITERKRAEEALLRLNEQLEVQVAQRTEDLRRTVNRLRQLTLELSQAEDRERKRIADILHEDVQQILAAARFHLSLLGSGVCSGEESGTIIEQVRQMLKDALEKSRSLSHELSPAFYQVDLTAILEYLARHMEQIHGLTVRVEAHGPVDSSSEPLKAFLYRVAQELLFNVVKHAGVKEARMRMRRRGQCICLSVVDQGRGFDPRKLEATAGFGLLGIQERVQLLGGRMKITSVPGRGSRFLIEVPDPEVSQAPLP